MLTKAFNAMLTQKSFSEETNPSILSEIIAFLGQNEVNSLFRL